MRLRGAFPSPRHKLAAVSPHQLLGTTPSQFLWKPTKLSMWLNDVDGDCVTAEEAFKCACNNPEIFITDDTVLAWATANNVLNGADLTTVMDTMRTAGFSQDNNLYNDGPYVSVDWTNEAVLQNAIVQGPVKIGVAADQLEQAVGTVNPPPSGWVATGFQKDTNEDHCVSLPGFGPASWLAEQLGVPSPGDFPAYALFTWSSIGIIDVPSMLAITGEAWLRNPGTITVPQNKQTWLDKIKKFF
jgi:hypothetical protein